jgi:hypothetical protein
MGRKAEVNAVSMMKAFLPGNVRVSVHIYDFDRRQYRPLPKRHARVSVDSPEQVAALWAAVVRAIQETAGAWPTDAPVDVGFGIETVEGHDGGDDGTD